MASFIDSGVWIAAFNSKDQYHKEGSKIIEALTENGIKDAHISDYIFNEVVIYIRKKIGCKESIETANSLLNSYNLRIIYVDQSIFNASYHIFQRYDQLSFTDSTIVVIMKNLKIKTLFSFDSGFDGIKDISRFIEINR